MSTVTLWQDGDPLSPSVLNSKLSPLLSGISGVAGIQVLSDGSSLGTTTAINFVGSSSVSSQAGQISVAVPQLTGTGTRYVRFNSGGTGIEDANLRDSGSTVDLTLYAAPAIVTVRRYNGSSSATTDIASNQSIGAYEFRTWFAGADTLVGAVRLWSSSVGLTSIAPRMEFCMQETNTGSFQSILQMEPTALSATAPLNKTYDLGKDGGLFNRIRGVQVEANATNNTTQAILRAILRGSYPNGGSVWNVYGELHSEAQTLRMTTGGNNNAGDLTLTNISSDEAYLSQATVGPVVRLGSSVTRFYALNVQGMSVRALNLVASYSATTADCVLSVDSTSNLTITLPDPSTVSGHVYTIKRAGAGTLEVRSTSTASIDNTSVYTVANQWDAVQVASVGTRYLVL